MSAPDESGEAKDLGGRAADVIHFPNRLRNGAKLVVIDTGAAATTGDATFDVDETVERDDKENSIIRDLERTLRLADAALGRRRTDLCINLVRSAARQCPSTDAG